MLGQYIYCSMLVLPDVTLLINVDLLVCAKFVCVFIVLLVVSAGEKAVVINVERDTLSGTKEIIEINAKWNRCPYKTVMLMKIKIFTFQYRDFLHSTCILEAHLQSIYPMSLHKDY